MLRINPQDVISAYKETGLIPVRKVWTTSDSRGGCAIDAVAQWSANDSGEAWASKNLDPNYTQGFVEAWDADEPQILSETEHCKEHLIGYWDAIICREAVETEFASQVSDHTSKTS